jgi:hypothetical protein
VGDALTPALGYLFVVHQARKAKYVFLPTLSFSHLNISPFSSPPPIPYPRNLCRIPRALTRRMILNLAISTSIGIVPGIGAIFVASYRANVRNARLLENFLAMRGERAAKAAQPATSEEDETKKDTGGDEEDDRRQGSAGEAAEDKPGAGSTSDGGAEKNTTTDQDDKGKNTIAAPDSADGDRRRYLRPPSSSLEFVQQRDSRFIEDVS